MSNQLASKIAIVTGSAGGFGKAVARAFLSAGATVVACDINDTLMKEAEDELAPIGTLHTVVGDLTDAATSRNLVKETVNKFGKVDILVNNAGVMDTFDPIGDVDLDFFDRVISINLVAAARLSKFAVQEFLREDRPGPKGGVILNVGSINGLRGGIAGVAYTTAKHGLVGLTRSTAAHYAAKGIRANIIMPGIMATNIRSAYVNGFNAEGRALSEKTLGLNPGTVELDKLAKLVVLSCSDDADYLNGAIISADCGWQAI